MKRRQIQPSAKFAEKTILKMAEAHDHRVLMVKIWVVLTMFAPIIFRQIWILVRRDYFSLSRWPFADYFVYAYKMLISSQAAIVMLALASLSAFMYLIGFRLLSPTLKYVGSIFSRQRAA